MARDHEQTRIEDAGGWIPLWRSWMRHPHYFTQEGREATSGEAFIDLLLRANYRTSFLIDRGEQIVIRPGQILTSIHSLANRWKWSRSRVRRWIDSCSKRGEIYTKSDHRRTVITLCNFDKWRFVSSTGVTTDVTSDVTSDEPVTDPSEEVKKVNKGDNRTRRARVRRDGFGDFWEAWPHKVGKKAAERAWQNAKDLPDLAAVLEAVEAYKRSKPPDRQWCNPATWINQGRWMDQPAAAVSAGRQAGESNFRAAMRRRLEREGGKSDGDHHRVGNALDGVPDNPGTRHLTGPVGDEVPGDS